MTTMDRQQLTAWCTVGGDWFSSQLDQFVTFEIFFGTFLRSCRILLIPTWKNCHWHFWMRCSMQHEYQLSRVRIIYDDSKHTVLSHVSFVTQELLPLDDPQLSIIEKNTTMAEPFAGPRGMAMGINSRPPPGNLFAMGWLRAHMKEFV